MLNARGDVRDSLINPLTSHPRWNRTGAVACVYFTVARRNIGMHLLPGETVTSIFPEMEHRNGH